MYYSLFFIAVFLTFVVENKASVVAYSSSLNSGPTWNLPRPALGYRSYMDVYPTRYNVPSGVSFVVFGFQALASHHSCSNVTVYFMLQHGSLPLVKQDSHSFPDNYIVPTTSSSSFEMKPGQGKNLAVFQPAPGPWFVIAYSKHFDTRIRQKGLSSEDKCIVNYMSSLQVGIEIKSQPLPLSVWNKVNISNSPKYLRFALPTSSLSFQVDISYCSSSVNCSVTLAYLPFDMTKAQTQDCDTFPCTFDVPSPLLGGEQLVIIKSRYAMDAAINLRITSFSCHNIFNNSCVVLPPLTRISTAAPGFSSLGYLHLNGPLISIGLSGASIKIIPFDMREPSDVGMTLNWKMHVLPFRQAVGDIRVRVCGSLLYNYLPDLGDSGFDACTDLNKSVEISMNGSKGNVSNFHVPYPQVGVWHVLLQASCFDKNGSVVTCPPNTYIHMFMDIQPCIYDSCGGKGECLYRTVGSDLVTYTACRCYANYRGYGCEDGSQALSTSVQLAGAFLLTMSNLMFIPAIFFGIRRRFFAEAFVYTYTMFFSTFYHACDGDRIDIYRLCIMDFDVLQSADFFGSSCAVWITLVAMAMIRIRHVTPFLQIIGPLCLFIGVLYDKTSLYVIGSPIIAGLTIIIISWGIKMYRRKKLYPSKKRYLCFLLPGIILATVAAVIYSFLETERNYKYIHSMWHICIAISVSCLLPPRNVQSAGYSKSETSSTTPLTNISIDGQAVNGTDNASQVYDN